MSASCNPPTDHGQALPAGTRLEEFVIERVLGSGGFGITYLARDTSLGRQVVIKENLPVQFCCRDTHSLTVSPRHTHGDDADNFRWSLENFSREAAMLASLDHPGIVRVLRSFEACGTAYFVMPFVEGVALDELAKERTAKAFTEEELRGLLERLLGALDYLHARGIYHRDIKPGNILIANDSRPVLIDFGSARQRLSERSMTVIESAGYTPFEQLQTRGNVGPWSDLYALGATLVKLMTGEAPPKTNDRSFGDPWQPLSGRADMTGKFSQGFLAGIDRALHLPIEERWQDAGEWLADLLGEKMARPVIAAARVVEPTAKPQPITTKMNDLPERKPTEDPTMDDEPFYEEVAKEIANDALKPGLWTKAFAEADADSERAKVIYIRLRVAQLMSAKKAELDEMKRLESHRIMVEEMARQESARLEALRAKADEEARLEAERQAAILAERERYENSSSGIRQKATERFKSEFGHLERTHAKIAIGSRNSLYNYKNCDLIIAPSDILISSQEDELNDTLISPILGDRIELLPKLLGISRQSAKIALADGKLLRVVLEAEACDELSDWLKRQ